MDCKTSSSTASRANTTQCIQSTLYCSDVVYRCKCKASAMKKNIGIWSRLPVQVTDVPWWVYAPPVQCLLSLSTLTRVVRFHLPSHQTINHIKVPKSAQKLTNIRISTITYHYLHTCALRNTSKTPKIQRHPSSYKYQHLARVVVKLLKTLK